MVDQPGNTPWNPLSGGGPVITLPLVENFLKMSVQNIGSLIQTIATKFPAQSATQSSLGILNSSAGGTTISTKTVGGYLIAIEVITASTTTGLIYDTNSPANVSSSNALAVIPSSGRVYLYGYPYFSGLTVQPSSVGGHAVSVFYI